jgi:plasmid stabilization system protein ParE
MVIRENRPTRYSRRFESAADDAAFVRPAGRGSGIAEAFRWYEARRSGLGGEFLELVRGAFRDIGRAPEQYPLAVDDIRKCVVLHFPYVVYFVVVQRGVSVLAVMHERRDSDRWRSRR